MSLGKNTGNATLLAPIIKDILPEGMGKPTNVVINSNGTTVNIKEGKSNANSYGEYYTWNESSRTLTAYINSVGINDTKGIEYDSKVVSGNDGDEKINKATATASNTTDKPSTSAKVTIKGDPKLKVSKTASPTTAKIGDTIDYKIYATNSGSAEPKDTTFTDVLPEGMGKPTDVTVKGVTIEVKLPEGVDNATSDGEYYEWRPSSRTLIVHTTGLGVSTGEKTVTYKSKILSGNDGDKKKNVVTLSASNTTDKPTAEATVTIKGEPKLEVSKTASPTTAKVGDSVKYTIIGKNTGNATLNDVMFTDVLPEGMSEPTDVTILGAVGDAYKLPKGASNANQFGEYYEWNASSRTMTVIVSRKGQSTGIIANGTGNESQRKITYTSKILNGQDGDKKTNTVTFSGSNGPTKPTAKATITVENKEIKLHIKQEIVNKNSQIVVPTVGSGSLQQVNIKDPSNVYENYGVTFPSYEADTNKDFKTVMLVWDDTYQTYVPKVSIPEFYSYTGYVLTTNNTTHKSSDRVQKELPSVNYSSNKEYWLTVYIEPKTSSDGPPFYNWDYKVNNLGKIDHSYKDLSPGDVFDFYGEDYIYLKPLGNGNHLVLRKWLVDKQAYAEVIDYNGGNLDLAMKAYYDGLSDSAKKKVQPVQKEFVVGKPAIAVGLDSNFFLVSNPTPDRAYVTSQGEKKAFALSLDELNDVSGTNKAFPTRESRPTSLKTADGKVSGGSQYIWSLRSPRLIDSVYSIDHIDGTAVYGGVWLSNLETYRYIRPALIIRF